MCKCWHITPQVSKSAVALVRTYVCTYVHMYMHRQGQAIALTPTESHTHALRVEPHMGWGSLDAGWGTLTCSHGTSSSCNSHTLTRESFEVSTEAQQIVAHTYVRTPGQLAVNMYMIRKTPHQNYVCICMS